MEILLLIGIFAFAVAAILRASEALTRSEQVEKELYAHEELAKDLTPVSTIENTHTIQTEKHTQEESTHTTENQPVASPVLRP